MTKQQKIIILSGLAITSVAYLIYSKVKRGQVYDELLFLINNTGSGGGNTNKNTNALKGILVQQIRQNNPNKNFIMLSQNKVKQYAEDLMSATRGAGTNENEISGVFSKLNDKVAVSQVASYFSGLYGVTLYDKLKDELNDDDFRIYVTDYLNKMPEVRFS